MRYRKLGRTDLDVSVICLGTMTWGVQNTQEEGHEQMDYALSQGVNFFDTAEMYAIPPTADSYGKTESVIGTWFKERKNRDKIILATKVAGPGLPWIRGGNYKIDKSNILKALEDSLKRLQTDYVDLYQLHWPNRGSYHFSQHWQFDPNFNVKEEKEDFLEVLNTLDELIKEGKIRHVGLSNETAWGTMKWLQLSKKHALPRMVSIQNEYSLTCRVFDRDLHEISVMEDIGLLAWSPLAAGMLSGKYLDGKTPNGSRWSLLSSRPLRDTPEAQQAVRSYIEIAKKYDLDVCQMAIAFVNERPFTTSSIIGATSMEQLKNNIAAIDLSLSSEIKEDIHAIYRKFPIPY